MYTLLVADDFALDRRQMTQAVESFTDLPLELIGECEDGVEALELIRDLKPDILLCDIEMPHFPGWSLPTVCAASTATSASSSAAFTTGCTTLKRPFPCTATATL
jgi:YesN/AraC family two-component response regulator